MRQPGTWNARRVPAPALRGTALRPAATAQGSFGDADCSAGTSAVRLAGRVFVRACFPRREGLLERPGSASRLRRRLVQGLTVSGGGTSCVSRGDNSTKAADAPATGPFRRPGHDLMSGLVVRQQRGRLDLAGLNCDRSISPRPASRSQERPDVASG